MGKWWESPDWRRMGTESADEVIRRKFLQLAVTLGSLSMLDRSGIAAEVAAQCVTGEKLVEQLDGLAYELAAQWDDGHPARLQKSLAGLYVVVGHVAENASSFHRDDLGHIAGRLAALLGLVYRFRDRDSLAERYLAAADEWARRVEDDHLRALAAVWRSDVDSAVQAGRGGPSERHVRAYLDLAERCAGTSAPPAVRALALLRQAEEHAAMGAADEALRYLDRADGAWANGGAPDDGLFGIPWPGQPIHAAFRGNVLILAERPAEALDLLVAVVQASSGSNAIAASVDYGSALARLGEVDAACEILTQAATTAHACGLADRFRRVVGVRNRDLIGHDDEPAVRRLDDAIRAATA